MTYGTTYEKYIYNIDKIFHSKLVYVGLAPIRQQCAAEQGCTDTSIGISIGIVGADTSYIGTVLLDCGPVE